MIFFNHLTYDISCQIVDCVFVSIISVEPFDRDASQCLPIEIGAESVPHAWTDLPSIAMIPAYPLPVFYLETILFIFVWIIIRHTR